jgi:hypothetical protein
MKTKLVFLLILSTLAIYCDPSIRKTENYNDQNILVGHWRHNYTVRDNHGIPRSGPTYELILNEDLAYSIYTVNQYSTYTISSESSEQLYYNDKGAYNLKVDTLFLVTSDQHHWNQVFIFDLDFKNQKLDLYALDEDQKSCDVGLVGEWYKIDRFGKRIGIKDVY